MESNSWVDFWTQYGKKVVGENPQVQVLRTINKQPITKENWEFCLNYIKDQTEINPNDEVLDLCCGNGLIAQYLAPKCKSVIAVDVSKELLDGIDQVKFPNISTAVKDMRDLDFPEHSFSKIIFYAAVQYLTLQETVLIFEKLKKWLKPNGILFIGDIPDVAKRWDFFNSAEREAVYFNTVKENRDIVGTWFERKWLEKLSNFAGFSKAEIIDQHPDMIYSFFRFDMKITN